MSGLILEAKRHDTDLPSAVGFLCCTDEVREHLLDLASRFRAASPSGDVQSMVLRAFGILFYRGPYLPEMDQPDLTPGEDAADEFVTFYSGVSLGDLPADMKLMSVSNALVTITKEDDGLRFRWVATDDEAVADSHVYYSRKPTIETVWVTESWIREHFRP